jgi:membrane associated rhomboid family serine protease
MDFSITLVLVIATGIISLFGFNNEKLKNDLLFYPPSVNRGQVYRFITHGFVHADPFHLIFNLIAFYSFGESVEAIFSLDPVFGDNGRIFYVVLYFSALIVASLPDYIKHRNDYYFRSLGASGAVSAVIFASILFNPNAGIGFAFIPGINIPGYIFGAIYVVVSTIMAKRGGDNIGHTAHLTGAVYGLIFTYITTKMFTDIDILDLFWKQVTGG